MTAAQDAAELRKALAACVARFTSLAAMPTGSLDAMRGLLGDMERIVALIRQREQDAAPKPGAVEVKRPGIGDVAGFPLAPAVGKPDPLRDLVRNPQSVERTWTLGGHPAPEVTQ